MTSTQLHAGQEQQLLSSEQLICSNCSVVTPTHLDAGQQQPQPPSGLQPPHPHEHRKRSKHHPRKDTGVDMDTLAEASAAASLLTVLLELQLPEDMQAALHPVLR